MLINDTTPRQAGAEVTPEMRRVGGALLYDPSGERDYECLAEEVYIAMASVKPATRPGRPQRLLGSEKKSAAS